MSTTVLHAPRIAAPASTRPFWQRVWSALEAHGQRRAAVELRRAAERHALTDPELAARLLQAAADATRA